MDAGFGVEHFSDFVEVAQGQGHGLRSRIELAATQTFFDVSGQPLAGAFVQFVQRADFKIFGFLNHRGGGRALLRRRPKFLAIEFGQRGTSALPGAWSFGPGKH